MLLFHDDLDEGATAFLLYQVVEHAQAHSLQYLCDVSLFRRDLNRYPEGTRNVLAQFPDSEFMGRDQYQDFIDGSGFRRTLLCRADTPLTRALEPDCITRFHLATPAIPVSDAFDPSDAGAAEFKLETGYTMVTDHMLTKAALFHLRNCWPAAVAYPVLQNRARAILAERTNVQETCSNENIQTLIRVLFDAAHAGHVELVLHPFRLTTAISDKPMTSHLARKQAETDTLVTNLRHTMVRLEDEYVRRLLMLVDGTRGLDQIVTDLREKTTDLPLAPDEFVVTRETVERHLGLLAKLALLVA